MTLCSAIERNKKSVNESNKVSIGVQVKRAWEKTMDLETGSEEHE